MIVFTALRLDETHRKKKVPFTFGSISRIVLIHQHLKLINGSQLLRAKVTLTGARLFIWLNSSTSYLPLHLK